MMGGTKMKKLLFITYMAALAALVGCQQDDELHTNPIPYVTFSASEEQTMVIHKPESLSVEIFVPSMMVIGRILGTRSIPSLLAVHMATCACVQRVK